MLSDKVIGVKLFYQILLFKVLNWVKTFVKDKVLSDMYLVKAILSLLFKLEVRCKGSSQLFDHITMQLFEIMGTVDEVSPQSETVILMTDASFIVDWLWEVP